MFFGAKSALKTAYYFVCLLVKVPITYNEYSVDEVLELLKSLPKDKAKRGIYLELCILFFPSRLQFDCSL